MRNIIPLTLISAIIRFFIILKISIISPVNLGYYTLINTLLITIFQIAQFDGIYLTINKIISYKKLLEYSKFTNSIYILISIVALSYLYFNQLKIAFILTLVTVLINYSAWLVDLSTINERQKNNKEGELIFKKNVLFQIIITRIVIPLIILGFLNFNILESNFYFNISALLLILSNLYISINNINLINPKDCSKQLIIKIFYFIKPLFIRKLNRVLFIPILFNTFGAQEIGLLQPSISLAKLSTHFTPDIFRLKYSDIFLIKKINNIIHYTFLSQIIYFIFPLIIYLFILLFNLKESFPSLLNLLILTIYYGNFNNKAILRGLYQKKGYIDLPFYEQLLGVALKLLCIPIFKIMGTNNLFTASYLLLLLIPEYVQTNILLIYMRNKFNK